MNTFSIFLNLHTALQDFSMSIYRLLNRRSRYEVTDILVQMKSELLCDKMCIYLFYSFFICEYTGIGVYKLAQSAGGCRRCRYFASSRRSLGTCHGIPDFLIIPRLARTPARLFDNLASRDSEKKKARRRKKIFARH